MASIEIDGKKIDTEPGMMIIEAADAHNIWIPRFCYHKKLSIAANCRMCLVEVEKSGKPLPACATPITDGMKIHTKSTKALMAQKAVMEFLLINHPLDCPICDQGGECELQDLSMGYGNDVSRFTEKKRVIKDKDIGPLVATDMTRCIQCTRCVRFGTEIAGVRELGAVGRGEHMEIGTFIEKNVESEVSGNIIDLCPVGALTSKPFRFKARGWELQQRPAIAAHDCLGSNIYVHILRNKVMRVVPRENETVNEIWISDRDRFSYEGLSVERLEAPKIKQNGRFETVSWAEALEYTADSLKTMLQQAGPKNLGAVLSPNASTEEAYLLQKFLRGLGSNNIDHRLRQLDFRHQEKAPAFPNLGIPIAEIEQQSLVLLLGSLIRQEQPLLGLKLRKLTQASGKVMVINPIDCEFNFDVESKIIAPGGDLLESFAKVVKAMGVKSPVLKKSSVLTWLQEIPEPEAIHQQMAEKLLNTAELNQGSSLILLGALALNHPDASRLIALATFLQEMTGIKVGTLTEGANAAGAWLAGAVPHRLPGKMPIVTSGFNVKEMWHNALKYYILFNIDPHLDCVDALPALEALKKADCVVAITPYQSAALESVADVLLPSTPFTETSGTFINVEGKWQTFKAVTSPYKESRPAWKILRVLGNLCDLQGFEYNSTEEILSSLKQEHSISLAEEGERGLEGWKKSEESSSEEETFRNRWKPKGITRIAPVSLYAVDNIVRRATALQNTDAARDIAARLHPNTAAQLGLTQQTAVKINSVSLPLIIDASVPENVVVIPQGVEETVGINGPYQQIEFEKIKMEGDVNA